MKTRIYTEKKGIFDVESPKVLEDKPQLLESIGKVCEEQDHPEIPLYWRVFRDFVFLRDE